MLANDDLSGGAPAASSLFPGQGQARQLMDRPTVLVDVPTLSASRQLVGRPLILCGVQLREATGSGSPLAVPVDTDVTANSGNVAAAAANVLLPGVAGQTTFISGFEVTGAGATGASVQRVTVTGLLGGTLGFELIVPAGAGTSITPLIVEFARPIPASGVNVGIGVNVPSLGLGNTNAETSAHGFQRLNPAGALGAPASADLLQGMGSGGELILPVALPAGGSISWGAGRDGPFCHSGVFLNMLSGSIRGSLWVKI